MSDEADAKERVWSAVVQGLDMAPDVAREILAWDIMSNAAVFAVFGVITIVCTFYGYRCYRKGFDWMPGTMGLGYLAAMFGICACCAIHETMYAVMAPRAYLLQKALHK